MADFPPPDHPPVETIPFDEFSDTAIKLKCGGQNQRNTFVIHPMYFHCTKLRTTAVGPFARTANLCNKVFPDNSAARLRHPCRNFISSNGVALSLYQPPRSCKRPQIANTNVLIRRGARCSITSGADIVDAFTINCRINGKSAPSGVRVNKRPCRNSYSSDMNIESKHFRRVCGTFPILIPTFKRTCNTKILGIIVVEQIFGYSNLGRCRIPQISVIIESGHKICFAPKVSDLSQTGAARLGICRSYEAMIAALATGKICNNIHSISKTQLHYTSSTTACKINNFSGSYNTKRFRCGTYLLATIETLVYGRILGGRYSDNFFTRETGRMLGKIR